MAIDLEKLKEWAIKRIEFGQQFDSDFAKGLIAGLDELLEKIQSGAFDAKQTCTEENPCRECLKKSVDGYKEIVRELEEKNRKLQEERDEWGRTAQEAIKTVFVRDHQLQSAKQEIERLKQERAELIEGLRSIRKELDRRFWESDQKWEREADMYEQGKSAAYDEADALICDILKECGVTVE